jgi:DNA polymerase-3 subunit epsilon
LNALNQNKQETESLLAQLTSIGYRFTRPFTARESYSDDAPTEKLLKAIILDTETTGVDHAKDRIIELGMVLIEYSPTTGQVYRVLETFNELEDPGIPIPPESIKVHGITDDMVQGKHINEDRVKALIAEASLIIAHNAKFDRIFVEERFPYFADKVWACSFAQMPWTEFLAYRYGFHYDAHRASNDCHALLEVLQQDLPESGVKALLRLLENARTKDYKVSALNSPFESKDVLKARGYRWDAERKLWSTYIAMQLLDQEVEWIRGAVYNQRSFKLELEKMDAFNRFSVRQGSIQVSEY